MRGGTMKRIYQLLAAAVVALLVPIVASVPASAVATCDIGYTGPDSNNLCTSVETYKCTVTNTNTVEIKNTTDQVVASGQVSTSGNTTGGNATSGSVTNTSGTTFSVTITNSAPESPGVCMATVTVPATETPTNGGGGAEGGQVLPASSAQPAALPVTSGDWTLLLMGILAGIGAITALLAVSLVVAYRHMHRA